MYILIFSHPSPITLEIDLGSIENCLLSYVNTKQTCKSNKQKSNVQKGVCQFVERKSKIKRKKKCRF